MRTWVSALAAVAMFTAVHLAGSASAAADCGAGVLQAWSDGTLDGEPYPVECYHEALDELPADVAAYSSAADDINRALLQRLRTLASTGNSRRLASAAPGTTATERRPQRAVAVLVGAAVLCGGAALVLVNVHRRKRDD